MTVIGLDLSLSRTGIAEHDGTARVVKGKGDGVPRLLAIEKEVLAAVWRSPTKALAVIEGYTYATTHAAHVLGELGGVIRVALWRDDVRYVVIAPGTLKKYATGKGNAGKIEVIQAAGKRLGYEGHDDNEADALWLRAIGLELLGTPEVVMPLSHREALAKVAL